MNRSIRLILSALATFLGAATAAAVTVFALTVPLMRDALFADPPAPAAFGEGTLHKESLTVPVQVNRDAGGLPRT
ncbi:hypothetical protein DAETH_45520 (plasmid) [Deinococcus aetherius]|uniref:Uncharacterized protein n=1 Tax=Deinococcus aetherius TaxID=200252 RepID=A0ABM8AL80_9DEIO|nr:hypothetical protein [Deinococcus aetherius]BDP44583.1 hypothetical protein DAETH_45520 [Deinococcus aetherius]